MVVLDAPYGTIHEKTSTPEPCHSGKIIKLPVRFTLLGETYEVIPEGLESNLYTYEKVMNDVWETGIWLGS